MSARADCEAVERLAGAIAIGEAGDAERETYRSHLALCTRCLSEFGGEREIERVMLTVSRARDDERWGPDLSPALSRKPSRRYAGSAAIVALAAAVAIAVGIRATEMPQQPPVAQRSAAAQEARAIAALNTQTAPRREGRAESLSLGPDVLAATVRVSVNALGTPTRCTIAKSSGNANLDRSMCRAAMRSRYSLETPAH